MKKLFFVFMVFLFFLQFVSAIDTNIRIDTIPSHDLRLNFLNPDLTSGTISFETKKISTGETGVVEYIFSGSAEAFNLRLTLIDNGTQVLSELINDVVAGETLYAMFIPGVIDVKKNYQELGSEEIQSDETIEELTNETVEEIQTVSGVVVDQEEAPIEKEEVSEEEFKFFGFLKFFRISGFASSEDGENSYKKWIYYSLGFVLLAGIVFFVFRGMKKQGFGNKGFKNDEEEIRDAEMKIQEAQDEIKEVRRRKIGI